MSDSVFLARQPILNIAGDVFAYELLFRETSGATSARIVDPEKATTQVIANALNDLGAHWLLNGRPAFVNLTGETLTTDFVELLPEDKIVVEILETVEPTKELVERIRDLRSLGMRFALDDYVHRPELLPFLELVDFVKIDVLAVKPKLVEEWASELRQWPIRLVAEKVETSAQRAWAIGQGFDLLQGYFFAPPENVCRKTLDTSTLRLAQLIAMLRDSWDPVAIESIVKRDPAITLKLLRFANAADVGAVFEISSIRQALIRLGPKKLSRWLTLLLINSNDTSPPWIASTAVIRGRFCELLGNRRLDARSCDDLFLLGVFSLLPEILQCDPGLFLDALDLAEPVLDAIRSCDGPLAPFLVVAESIETGDPQKVEDAAARFGFPADDVNKAHMNAIAWCEAAT